MPNNYLYGNGGIHFVTYSLSHSIETYFSHSYDFSGSLLSASEISYTASNYVNPTSSFIIGSNTINSEDFTIKITSQSLNLDNDLIPFYISPSIPDPLIGINTSNPLSNLDIRAASGSSPASLILRTNEDGIIQEGEETGRIIFAIESSSYNFNSGSSFISSGSTAAIFSRVINTHPVNGAYGSLVFEVNDSTNVTEPIEAMTIGYGLGPANDDIGFILSGSVEIGQRVPEFRLVSTVNGNETARIGYVITEGSPFDRGAFNLNDNGVANVKLNWPNQTSYINDGNNLAIGTTIAPEQLTVEGSISASGNIIGTINGGSF